MTSLHDSATPGRATGNPIERPDLPASQGDAPAFWILGLLMIGLCLGLMFEAPGILVVLLVLATPALIRTCIASARQRAEGAPPSGLSKVGTFISSVGVIALIGLAAGGAFYATCFAVCLGGLSVAELNHGKDAGWILIPSVGAGLAVGLWVAVRLIRRHWSRKGKA